MTRIDTEGATQLARNLLCALTREFPNKPAHVLQDADDLAAPSLLTPSFYGCFDWHSAVHMHWSLVRLLRLFPEASFAHQAVAALGESLSKSRLAGELAFRKRHPGHELPYGVAWLLTLQAELEQTGDPLADHLRALSDLASGHFALWLTNLPCPIRSGEHSQSAFAMSLVYDAAHILGKDELAQLIIERAIEFYAADRDGPLSYEPSAHDFLSPCLAEADLLRRVLAPDAFRLWWDGFLGAAPLRPVTTRDRSDGKLAHWDGLNLSRSWMLEAIATALPAGHPHRGQLRQCAEQHLEQGLQGLNSEHYAASHWLTSFALYAIGMRC